MKNLLSTLLALCGSISLCSLSHAQVGGYRLISQAGEVGTTPPDFVKSISWPQLSVPSGPQKVQSLNALLADLVDDFQSAIRVEPDPNATSLQRDQLEQQKYDHIAGIGSIMPGRAVYATFHVLDVVPAPSTPKEKAPAAFLIYGLFDWKSSPVITPDDRHKILAINQKYDAADKKAQADYDAKIAKNTHAYNGGTSGIFKASSVPPDISAAASRDLANAKTDDANKRRAEITQVRADEKARVPRHMIYIYTDDTAVQTWHRDEDHKVFGFIQKFAAFHYTPGYLVASPAGVSEPLQDAYVSMEFVVKGVKDPTATTQP